ncbi:MAG: hypothetical protein GWP17_00560 [Aquificales bacterium]|nr:hypothetical protein [Aquificales bacterium]
MNDLVKYSASVKRRSNHTDELVKKLLFIFEQELYAVVARDVKVTSSLVTFHGGASRTAPKRHRRVTNWNLLSPITRGAVRVEGIYPQVAVSFWLGFPKWVFVAAILFIVGMVILLTTVFLTYGEPLLDVLFAVLLIVVAAFVWIGIMPLTISIIRFHWFVRKCIRKAEREIAVECE